MPDAHSTGATRRVNIRPGVGILSVLRHLNYKPWFALAEFVDNSLQSFLASRAELKRLHGDAYRLRVDIELDRSDEMRLTIRDNAAGIASSEYGRAFRPAELPPERSGLAEFGMGMKSAACWFAPRWQVRTCALGESVERTISFDIASIVRDDIQELEVSEAPARSEDHFTEISLLAPYNKMYSRTGSKIREHLASIYRIFLREGLLDLRFDGESLQYEIPGILVQPYFRTPTEPPLRWIREFDFDFGLGLRAFGFAALRETASTATAGFALFRRKRLIEGSWDEPYRPELIFGSGNSYRKQRLFGEIHLEGFDVSHTKDGFKWDDHEQTFLELLREVLESPDLPLLSEAEGFRARVAQRELRAEAERANERVAEAIAKDIPPVLEAQTVLPPVEAGPTEPLPEDPTGTSRVVRVQHRGTEWVITIELSTDPGVADWLSLSDLPASGNNPRQIMVRMSLAHPFMQRYCRAESSEIEALERVAAAIALAEVTARDAGVPQYGTVRRNVNQILREALSNP